MFDEFTEAIQGAVTGNEFFSGGFVLMLLGAAGVALRKVPRWLVSVLVRQFSVEVEVRAHQALRWLDLWLRDQPVGRRCRRLKVAIENARRSSGPPKNGEDPDAAPDLLLVPGMGHNWFRHRGRLFLLERRIEDGQNTNSKEGSDTRGFADLLRQEVVTIRTAGRNARPIHELLETARREVLERDRQREEIVVSVNRYGDWYQFHTGGRGRPLSSVILADGLMEEISDDLSGFLAEGRHEWYRERGVPYRRGYLFEGPPGSGKSSLVRALIGAFDLHLYVLDLTADRLADTDVARLLADVPPRSAILIEDVDRLDLTQPARVASRRDRGSQVTMSGFLNALDGVIAAEGRIVFFTANEPSKLDGALTREGGRIDRRFVLGPASPNQAGRLYARFFPDDPAGALQFGVGVAQAPAVSMAELQGILIRHHGDPKRAVAAALLLYFAAEVRAAG